MDAIVRFQNISKTYDGITRVVRNLDLEVASGEFLTLLGPSGSGKTTSLMMLAGFEAPTTGEIILAGQSLAKLPPYKRDIGVVFQNYALFPHMTVEENIRFPLKVRKMATGEIGHRVERALEMVRLPGFAQRKPNELSGGQQQRVALARALVFEPKVVLMDEPLGALDRQLREEMQLEIRSLHEALGITVVYVTHDQGEALTMSDRIAVFNNGVIEQLASPEGLYESPENVFVARFVGENNLLSGAVETINGDRCEIQLKGLGVARARPRDLRANHSGAVITVRPEHVEIGPDGLEAEEANVFPAVLEEVIYLGDHIKVIALLADGQKVVAKLPTGRGNRQRQPGQQVSVVWKPENCMAFAPEQDRDDRIHDHEHRRTPDERQRACASIPAAP